jgi:hypothetical protein
MSVHERMSVCVGWRFASAFGSIRSGGLIDSQDYLLCHHYPLTHRQALRHSAAFVHLDPCRTSALHAPLVPSRCPLDSQAHAVRRS